MPFMNETMENMLARKSRYRDVETGRLSENGEKEVIRFLDDGYRIVATWVSGLPDEVSPNDWWLIASYKEATLSLGKLFSDCLMGTLPVPDPDPTINKLTATSNACVDLGVKVVQVGTITE